MNVVIAYLVYPVATTLVPEIARLGQDFGGKVGLAISLHAADDDTRTRLMPINKKYPLPVLMDAAEIKDWLGAGHEIGAHSLTHPFLTRVSLREARVSAFTM